jgi:chromosome segregation ATPase
MDTVLDRLQKLEVKVQESIASLAGARAAREALEARLQSVQGELRAREQEVAVLRKEREQDTAELGRLRSEREEIRSRVEGLLEEIGRLETALQAAGGPGGNG